MGERRHWHQRRIRKTALEGLHQALVGSEEDFKATKNFDSLHDLVAKRRIIGVRRIVIYDTALRLGAYFKSEPRGVYLHAGTKVGAKKLAKSLGDHALWKACRGKVLDVKLLPEPMRTLLRPWQIEDFLCIYKDDF